jgi:cathepsin A (carboxypeptidase C)
VSFVEILDDDIFMVSRFFESRTAPADAPLILWLNGGPGCSSSTGLLFELGPCSIKNEGHNVTHNPYSWNTHANIIFLDQPVNVGYSYAEDGTTVSTSPVAGKDVYAFLELFLNRYPQYSKAPFHIAAESYGGTYAPNFANIIFKANKELQVAPNPKLKHINLASVVLANGLTDPYTQMGSVADYVCDGPYPVYDDPDGPQCAALRSKIPTCQRLIKACYNFNSKFTCVPATAYCNSQLFGSLMRMHPFNF